ncbi:uncharacterized protein DFL_005088 [Arthrobotrys flagrans]|uniref:Uncharacterized protein n=1 Tax=Arthrobotrys flagrans TaxID=97331 RepID=A0A437A6Q3_ARTFL|nr:hypothetical protein DFL_005088 [Arthrobotrys flagrans]
MAMNYMLVCTPVNLEHLITERNSQPILATHDFFSELSRHQITKSTIEGCIEKHLRRHGPEEDLWQYLLTSQRMAELLSVYEYTVLNTFITDYLKNFTLRGMATRKSYPTKKALWADEVLSWYLRSWWYAMVRFRNVVTTTDVEDYLNKTTWLHGEEKFDNIPRTLADKWGWCDIILLEDGDFTNVNFVRFTVAMGA